MPKEFITIQIGQCGNQIGTEFWKKLRIEHGIGKDGKLESFVKSQYADRKDIFFNIAGDNHYVPKAILIDLEPRVINSIMKSDMGKLFNKENVFIDPDGGGAGNNWVNGFHKGKKYCEEISDIIDREAENSDNIEAFMICHSVAGGTGSGVGSFIHEEINDRYPKKFLQTCCVLPNIDESSDVVVQPYNTILSLKTLITNSDAVLVLDNASLNRIAINKLKIKNPSFLQTNNLISNVMAASTNTLRFPGSINHDLVGLLTCLIPSPRCHFLVSSYFPHYIFDQINSPINADNHKIYKIKTSESNILQRLLDNKNIMFSCQENHKRISDGRFISALSLIQGNISHNLLDLSYERICLSKLAKFTEWQPKVFQIVTSKNSPYLPNLQHISGAMLANHTSIGRLFLKFSNQFNQLYKRKAFLDRYWNGAPGENEETIRQEMEDSKKIVDELVDEYKSFERIG